MRVQRVSAGDVNSTYPCATESPPPFWASGLHLSREWFATHLGEGVEGFHLKNDIGDVIGHIYWAPGKRALVPYRLEEGVVYEYCEWVQRGWQGKGGMRILFQAFVDHARSEGYKGILVDGTEYEGYMHFRHFLERGFRVLEEDGGKLLYYPITQEGVRVERIPMQLPSACRRGICVIGSLFCPVGASAVLAIRQVVEELGEREILQEIPSGRDVIERYGVADGIFINGKPQFFGPVTEEEIRKTIRRELGTLA